MGVGGLGGIRVVVGVESDGPLTVFSGGLVKTLVYVVAPELQAYRGVRGIVSPLHVSPLFTVRGDAGLGDLVSARFRFVRGEGWSLEPVDLGGEYVFHVGGDGALVERVRRGFEGYRGSVVAVRYADRVVRVRVEKVVDAWGLVEGKALDGDRVTLYLKGPVKPFNIYAPTRLPKFSPSAYEVLMTAFLLARGELTVTTGLVLEAMRLLGQLVETYYSLNTLRPILVPLAGGRREPGMTGKITYIVEARRREERELIERVLVAAELAGVGESRMNGFGTVVWAPKG